MIISELNRKQIQDSYEIINQKKQLQEKTISILTTSNTILSTENQILEKNKLLKEFRLVKQKINGKCKNCERLDFCRGGCRGITYSFLKNLESSDPTCKFKEVKKWR